MNITRVLAVLTGITLLVAAIGCSTAPAEVAPTPNIDATVEARVAQELAAQPKPNIDATVEARLVQKLAAQPTATPYPTYTPVPTAILVPTATPAPTPVPTVTPVPTATPIPIPTPVPTATPIPPPTPIPVIPITLRVVDEFFGLTEEVHCGLPSTILPMDVQKTSVDLPELGLQKSCGGNEVIQYWRFMYHNYLLEISNPNPDPYVVDILRIVKDQQGYQQSSFTETDVFIRANSSRLRTLIVQHECIISYEYPGNPCEAWNGFWEVESSVELFPDYEHQLTPGLLANDWGIHNTTDSDWEVGAVCVMEEYEAPLFLPRGHGLFEFPGHPKLKNKRSTWIRWEVIKSQQKKMAIGGVPYRTLWSTCDFYSKKR